MHETVSPPINEGFKTEEELIPHDALPELGPWGKRLFAVIQLVAYAGGLLLLALVVMSVISIVGRKLYSAPIPGDIELLQMGTAVAAAAMLAYCEMLGKHLKVDFFTASAGTRTKAIMDGIAHLILGLAGALIAWRTAVAAVDTYAFGETSMVLGWAVWPAIALIVPGLALFALAGLYNATRLFGKAAAQGERA
jgi:TRAP-type mannitol/chloroaromatic compound transport system permease small subunit